MPPLSHRRLERNTHRRRLGGVCAGIADATGIETTWIRLLFLLSVFFSAGLTLWIYLALWFLLPATSETPMPAVSWQLRRDLRRCERQLAALHRKHAPSVADLAQETYELIKGLAPNLESNAMNGRSRALREAALVQFPQLLDALLSLPAGTFSAWSERAGPSPANRLLGQLEALRTELQRAALERFESELRGGLSNRPEPESSEIERLRQRLAPLLDRLREHSAPATVALLESIEDRLGFLLRRTASEGDSFDLRPFEVRKIAFEYLPETLDQYLQLPVTLARSEPLGSGKTAEESLDEQLRLLDTTLHDLTKSLFQKDATSLLIHGRFLREKFAERSFDFDPSPTRDPAPPQR